MCGGYSYVYCATSFVINWLKWVATWWTRNAVVYINVCLWNLMYVHLKTDVKIQKALVNRNFGTVDFPFFFFFFWLFIYTLWYHLLLFLWQSTRQNPIENWIPHPKTSGQDMVLIKHAYHVITIKSYIQQT